MEIRGFADRTALLMKDLDDQSDKGPFVFIFRNSQGTGSFYCDDFEIVDGTVVAFRHDSNGIPQVIHGCDVRSEWNCTSADLYHKRSQREAIEIEHKEFVDRKALLKQIDPKGAEEAEKLLSALGGGVATGDQPGAGQYL